MEYGQLCPVAKTTEIIGEKRTLLISRELLMGDALFNQLHHGLSLFSPIILPKRLKNRLKKTCIYLPSGLQSFYVGFFSKSYDCFAINYRNRYA